MPGPVLIVDDEPTNLATLRGILADEFTLVYARSGAEALTAVAKHQPALILLDIMMPDMDGMEVCRQLKANENTRNIPVIFVTALADTVDETAGFAAGAVDYIVKPVSPSIVRARVRTHLSLVRVEQLQDSYHDAIHMMGNASRFKDTDTGAHIWRIAGYSRTLAEALGWNEEMCNDIALAAPMHDLGKLGIPDAILHKPGKLDADEWRVMQTHSEMGYAILAPSKAPLLQMAACIARHHHERWDGSGYPGRLSGEGIPIAARIVAIADVFDALSCDRPYKLAWEPEAVVAHMRGQRGMHFEPRLVDLFTGILPTIYAIQSQFRDEESIT
jgi:putative two-component system response regulator